LNEVIIIHYFFCVEFQHTECLLVHGVTDITSDYISNGWKKMYCFWGRRTSVINTGQIGKKNKKTMINTL